MLIQDWIYFKKVVECRSITKAASELYRTYQGVYKSIAKLEEEYGRELFVRENNRMTLTPFGSFVYDKLSLPMLDYWDRIQDAPSEYERYRSGRLSVALFFGNSPWIHVAVNVVKDFSHAHPDAAIDINYVSYRTCDQEIRDRVYDIGMCIERPENADLKRLCSFKREYSLYVGENHPLADRDFVTISDLRDYTFLFFNRNDICTTYLIQHGIEPNRLAFLDTTNPGANAILASGAMIRIAANDAEKALNDAHGLYKGCVRIPFRPGIFFTTAFMYRDEPYQNALLSQLIEYIRQKLPDFITD